MVLTPRRWCQVCEKERRRRWPKRPEHRGEHGVAVKTIAWGMPGDSGVTCMLVCAFYYILHTRPRAHRPPGIPCALNSERAGNNSKTRGAAACEIAKSCLGHSTVVSPHAGISLTLQGRVKWQTRSARLTNFWHCGLPHLSFRTGRGSALWQQTVNGFGRESGFQRVWQC